VPLLWYGSGIKHGNLYAPISVSDIAPTLSAFLKIMEPSASTGKVIEQIFVK
jgi:phosphopentomutase